MRKVNLKSLQYDSTAALTHPCTYNAIYLEHFKSNHPLGIIFLMDTDWTPKEDKHVTKSAAFSVASALKNMCIYINIISTLSMCLYNKFSCQARVRKRSLNIYKYRQDTALSAQTSTNIGWILVHYLPGPHRCYVDLNDCRWLTPQSARCLAMKLVNRCTPP